VQTEWLTGPCQHNNTYRCTGAAECYLDPHNPNRGIPVDVAPTIRSSSIEALTWVTPTLFAISGAAMVLCQLAWLLISQPHAICGQYTALVSRGLTLGLPDVELDQRPVDHATPYAPLLRLELISNGHVREAVSQYFDQHLSQTYTTAVSITSASRILSLRSIGPMLPLLLVPLIIVVAVFGFDIAFAPEFLGCAVTITGIAKLAGIAAGCALLLFLLAPMFVLIIARYSFLFYIQLSDGTALVAMYTFSLYEPQYAVFKDVPPTTPK